MLTPEQLAEIRWVVEHIEIHHEGVCGSLVKWAAQARKLWPEAFADGRSTVEAPGRAGVGA
jgi:hypothetical protein